MATFDRPSICIHAFSPLPVGGQISGGIKVEFNFIIAKRLPNVKSWLTAEITKGKKITEL